jgi:hypothetical protein
MAVLDRTEPAKKCASCDRRAEIVMRCYTYGDDVLVCRHHALQLSRKLLEDLCDIDGDRHG